MDITAILHTFECVVQRIVFEPVFGNNLRMILQEASQPSVINSFALFIVVGLVAVISSNTKIPSLKNKLPMFGFLFFVMFSLTFVSVVGRSVKYENFLSFPWGQRYFYIQQLLFIFIIVMYIVSLVSWKRLATGAKIGLLIFLFSYVYYLNIQHAPFFTTSKESGIATIQFLQEADRHLNNSKNRGEYPRQMVLHRGGKWDIKIILPGNTEGQN
jgi:hypothetical protein